MAAERLIWDQISTAKTATFSTGDVQGGYDRLQLLLNLTAVAGTTPQMIITIEAKDENGNYYPVATLATITATGKTVVSAGPGLPAPGNIEVPKTFRLTFTISGTTPSFTFVADLYGHIN